MLSTSRLCIVLILVARLVVMAPGIAGGGIGKAKDQAKAIAALDAVRGEIAFGNIARSEKQLGEAERRSSSRPITEARPGRSRVRRREGDSSRLPLKREVSPSARVPGSVTFSVI